MTFTRLTRATLAVVATCWAVLALGATPASAQASALPGLLLEPPLPGYEAAPAPIGYDGPVDVKGNHTPEGSPADSASGFVAGWRKMYVEPGTGRLLMVEVTEFEEAAAVDFQVKGYHEDDAAAGAAPFAVAGVPRGWGATYDATTTQGVAFKEHRAMFPYGRYVFFASTTSTADPMSADSHAAVLAATTHFDHFASVVGEPESAEADKNVLAYNLGRAIVRLGVVICLLIGLVGFLWRKVRGRRTSYAGPPPMVGLGDEYVPPPAAPAPRRPAFDPMGPESFAPPSGAPAMATSTATATFAEAPEKLESQPCPSCGDDFGLGHECESCGAVRRQCVVCGTKIWAGATTCSEHSGVTAWS